MTDRETGAYTHETLLALEDSHHELMQWVKTELGWLRHIKPLGNMPIHVFMGFDQAERSGEKVLAMAKQARKEAGI